MPHLVIEISRQVFDTDSARRLLLALHETAAGTGIVQGRDLKLRIVPIDIALVGKDDEPFVHLTFALLAGRSPEQKLTLSTLFLGVLCKHFPLIGRCSVEIRDMDSFFYKKRQPDHVPIPDANWKDDPC